MRICFDLDNALCIGKPYSKARPLRGAIQALKTLHDDGHTIIIYTARGMESHPGNQSKVLKEIIHLTLKQLERWGFVYDEIHFGKPSADIYVDERSINTIKFGGILEHVAELSKYMQKSKIDKCVNKIDSLLEKGTESCHPITKTV